jgi:hypothetical protein
LILALIIGLLWGKGARWAEEVILPALILILTLSTMGVSGSALRSFRTFFDLFNSSLYDNLSYFRQPLSLSLLSLKNLPLI